LISGRDTVLAYLARYTHRVAISNSRLIALNDNGRAQPAFGRNRGSPLTGGRSFRGAKYIAPISLVAVSSQPTGRTRSVSREASASLAMRLSARRSRRQSSRLIFCSTITYAWMSALEYV